MGDSAQTPTAPAANLPLDISLRRPPSSSVPSIVDSLTDPALVSRARGQRWKRQIAIARREWERLSDDELLHSNGRRSALTGLLRTRYALSHSQADLEVRRFLMCHVQGETMGAVPHRHELAAPVR